MPKIKLTKAFIKTAEPGTYFDEVQPGFLLRVTAGAKGLYARGNLGKGSTAIRRQIRIGDATMDLELARKRAAEFRSQLAGGIDPVAKSEAESAGGRVRDAAMAWVDDFAPGKVSEADIRRIVEQRIIPAIGSKRPADVTTADVLDMVEKIAAEGKTRLAEMTLGYTGKMFDRFAVRGLVPVNPARAITKADVLVRGKRDALKSVVRERVLTEAEIVALWSADPKALKPMTRTLLLLVLLTGQRPGEVRQMREQDIDGGWWTVPAEHRGKTSKPSVVYLCDLALDLIEVARAEQARLGRPGGLLFDQKGNGRAMGKAAVSRAAKRFQEGIEDYWTPHDLRRTLETQVVELGFSEEIAEAITGHARKGTARHYNHSSYRPQKQMAMTAYGSWVEGVVGIDREGGDNVVRLGN